METQNHPNGAFEVDYSTDGFATLLEFGSAFANADGVASTAYEHTWSTTGVTGITVGNSGWLATLGSGSSGWPASSSDTAY